MSNSTTTLISSPSPASNQIEDHHNHAAVIAAPVIFGLILTIVLFTVFIIPRFKDLKSFWSNDAARKSRMEKFNAALASQSFKEWTLRESKEPEAIELRDCSASTNDAHDVTCAICLEKIDDAEQVRALMCKHVFHAACLDPWFEQDHDNCPLCHKPIMPAQKPLRWQRVRLRTTPRPNAQVQAGDTNV